MYSCIISFIIYCCLTKHFRITRALIHIAAIVVIAKVSFVPVCDMTNNICSRNFTPLPCYARLIFQSNFKTNKFDPLVITDEHTKSNWELKGKTSLVKYSIAQIVRVIWSNWSYFKGEHELYIVPISRCVIMGRLQPCLLYTLSPKI